jgi:hypothetical protein
MRARGIGLMAAAFCIAGFECGDGSAAVQEEWSSPSLFATLKTNDIDESSGIAPSHLHPGEYWTHNDDGRVLEAFRFNAKGEAVKFTFPNQTNRDVEDMATAKIGGKAYVYLADIGDNQKQWSSIRIYRFEEPSAAGGQISKVDVIEATYEDGKHNAEAFMVDPKTGAFWIVEKTSEGAAGIYWLEKPKPGNGNQFKKVGSLQIESPVQAAKSITGGAISADGTRVVIRTYLSAMEFAGSGAAAGWHEKDPKAIRLAIEGQGEAITYSLDGKSILTTSEGSPCPVSIVKRK